MDTTFARVIEEHLELKRRNSALDPDMPISRYRVEDPFQNHPLFKTEEQARLEDTLSGSEPDVGVANGNGHETIAWPGPEAVEEEAPVNPEDTLWGRSRDFDWGD